MNTNPNPAAPLAPPISQMTPNKFQRLLLRQYRQLHEARSPGTIVLSSIVNIMISSLIIAVAAVLLLWLSENPFLAAFIHFAAGLVLGAMAVNLGLWVRRAAAWKIVEEITNWDRVYELLDAQNKHPAHDGS